VVAAHFLDRTAAFVLAEDAAVLVPPQGEEQRVAIDGGILSSVCDGSRIVIGGDTGRVLAIDTAEQPSVIGTDPKRRWIDQVALGPDGAVAWSAGKTVTVKTAKGEERSLDLPSSAGGLAFAPKGFRLAIAHYNGVSLWFPKTAAPPEFLEWKGSHLGVTFSPDGKFLVTTMQEPGLHGWRLADRKHMRMAGYSTKVRSLDWSADGRWLASSGSEQLILWPYQSKDGPMGQPPRMLAPYQSRVCTVACHPAQEVVAAGFEDGLTVLVRVNDGAEIIARRPGGAPVSALAWEPAGSRLAIGTEDGDAGLVDLS
jgi:WD40 repeat protein